MAKPLVSDELRELVEPLLPKVERRYRQGQGFLAILRGAELAVWPGEIVALVAPSGTGKSTLLHLAGLLERPDGGEVFVEGRAAGTLFGAHFVFSHDQILLFAE